LNDDNVQVKRDVLDFLKLHLPIDTSLIKPVHKENLVESALKCLNGKEYALNRRVLDWICPYNNEEVESLEYIIQALR